MPKDLLMCGRHWRMVPRPLQLEVYQTYRKSGPTEDWAKAANAAIAVVAEREAYGTERRAPPPGTKFVDVESLDVASWCPTPDASGPATQVHVIVRVPGAELVMRLKSARAVQELIDALAEHRNYTWPEVTQ